MAKKGPKTVIVVGYGPRKGCGGKKKIYSFLIIVTGLGLSSIVLAGMLVKSLFEA